MKSINRELLVIKPELSAEEKKLLTRRNICELVDTVWVSSVAWCWPTQTNIKGVYSCPLEMTNSITLPTLVILSEEA